MDKMKTDGMNPKGVTVHGGLKNTGNRVPMGVSLPKANMDFTRTNVPDQPTIGPRVA